MSTAQPTSATQDALLKAMVGYVMGRPIVRAGERKTLKNWPDCNLHPMRVTQRMPDPAVIFEKRDKIGVISLARPETLNAMNPEMFADFDRCLAEVRADEAIRCLVITGTGKAFCAGANLRAPLRSDEETQLPHERSFAMYESFLGVLQVEVPVIAALNGHAVGGGFGLALLCDIRIASRSGKYGANFAKLGIHSGLGISYTLPKLVGTSEAARMLFTGELIDADKGQRIGLFSEAAESDEVLGVALALAAQIAAAAPLAVRSMKRSLYQNLDWNPRAAARQEAYSQAKTLQTRDADEGVQALLEKRTPRFEGR